MLDFDFNAVLDALLSDLPFDLYWYDKTSTGGSVCSGYGIGASGNSQDGFYLYLSTTPILTMYVSVNYAVNKEQYKTTEVDSSKIATVNTAITNAQSIANAHKNEELVTMLTSYKNEICNLVDYDHDAIAAPKAPYGDPWQLIHVFDGVSSTKVVCEGYSKAFKYLCDLSGMTNATCLIATGTMAGGTGAGGHMWNVINMDDNRSYMIDVTNCDIGAAGYPDKLFLKVPASGSYSTSYVFSTGSSSNITYTYDEDTIATIPEKYLTLSTTAYTGPINSDDLNRVMSSSVTFNGEIGLNFYLKIPDAVVGNGVITILNGANGEKKKTLLLSDKDTSGRYKLTYLLNSIQMNTNVSLVLKNTNGDILDLYNSKNAQFENNIFNYSVLKYLQVLEIMDNENYSNLAKAMKNYGAYAELFFIGSTAIPHTNPTSVTADELVEYKMNKNGTISDDINVTGMSLIFDDKTDAKVFFTASNGLNGHTFVLDGVNVTPVFNGTKYFIKVNSVPSNRLKETHTLIIDDYVVTFSAMTYAYSVLNYSGSSEYLISLCRALYDYSNAAEKCFGT